VHLVDNAAFESDVVSAKHPRADVGMRFLFVDSVRLPRERDRTVLTLQLGERAGAEANVSEEQLAHEARVAPRLRREVRECFVGRRENRHALLAEELWQLVGEPTEGEGVADRREAGGARAAEEVRGGLRAGGVCRRGRRRGVRVHRRLCDALQLVVHLVVVGATQLIDEVVELEDREALQSGANLVRDALGLVILEHLSTTRVRWWGRTRGERRGCEVAEERAGVGEGGRACGSECLGCRDAAQVG